MGEQGLMGGVPGGVFGSLRPLPHIYIDSVPRGKTRFKHSPTERDVGGELPHYLLLFHSGEMFAPNTWPEQMEGADEDKSAPLSSGREKKEINCRL